MDAKKWDPKELLGLSGIYWQTCTLHAAVRLGVFTELGASAKTAGELAALLTLDKRATEVLLNALTAMGLLVKEDQIYRCTEQSFTYLNKKSPSYIGYMIMHHHFLMEPWARLHEAVRSGRPTRSEGSFGSEERESFLMGMFNLAMAIAPAVAERIDLSWASRLLDLGGGPGTYAAHFVMKNPGLKAEVFDLPETRPFAERIFTRFDVSKRVGFIAGDYLKDPIPSGYDVVWLSQVLHGEGPEECLALIRKALSSLRRGGRLFIHEFILEDSKVSPFFPALFSLNMLINTKEGRSYCDSELREMLFSSGAVRVERLDFTGPMESGILCAWL